MADTLRRSKRSMRLKPTMDHLERRIALSGDDPDDTIDEAIPTSIDTLTTPFQLNERFDNYLDVDMFKLIMGPGDEVDIDIDITSDDADPAVFDPHLNIFFPNGNVVWTNSYAAAPGETTDMLAPYYRLRSDLGGTYYIGISGAPNVNYNPITGEDQPYQQGSGAGNYDIILTPTVANDANDQMREAGNLGDMTTARRGIGVLDTKTDVDMYKFTVGAKRWITFDLDRGSAYLVALLRIFDSSGAAMNRSYRDSNAVNEDTKVKGEAYMEQYFLRAGTYYVGVSTYANRSYNPDTGGGDASSEAIGDYSLLVSPIELWGDPNDTLAESTNLGSASSTRSFASEIEGSFDVDILKFTVTANQRVNFALRPLLDRGSLGVWPLLRLFDSRGVQLRNASRFVREDIVLSQRFTKAGTYYIAVSASQNNKYDPKSGFNDVGNSSYFKSKWNGQYTLTMLPLRASRGPRMKRS